MYRCVLIKGPMSSGCVIVTRVGAQQMAQMRLAKDDDVVQAFAANGPDQSFGKAVLPRRARSDRFIPECPLRGGAVARRNRRRGLDRGSGTSALTPKETPR